MPSIYECLQAGCIRLLTLHPGKWGDPLTAYLASTQLCPSDYTAISYAWGSPKATGSIVVNGNTKRITVNLDIALRMFRHVSQPKRLWVDSICINQENTPEKNQQVDLMFQIFNCASSVWAYLGDSLDRSSPSYTQALQELGQKQACVIDEGDDDDDGSLIWEPLHLVLEKLETTTASDWSASDRCDAVFYLLRGLSSESLMERTMQHRVFKLPTATVKDNLRQLFEWLRLFIVCPWWERMWVTQEIGVARTLTIAYGRTTIAFDHLANLAFLAEKQHAAKITASLDRENAKVFDLLVKKVSNLAVLRYQHWKKFKSSLTLPYYRERALDSPLLWLLRSFRHRKSSDPRDKVFALAQFLKVLPDQSRIKIRANYNTSVSHVYADTVFRLIAETGVFWINTEDLTGKWKDRLPSFVPNWSDNYLITDPKSAAWMIRLCYNCGSATFLCRDGKKGQSQSEDYVVSAADYYGYPFSTPTAYRLENDDDELVTRTPWLDIEENLSAASKDVLISVPSTSGIALSGKPVIPTTRRRCRFYGEDKRRAVTLDFFDKSDQELTKVETCLNIYSQHLVFITRVSAVIEPDLSNLIDVAVAAAELFNLAHLLSADHGPDDTNAFGTSGLIARAIKTLCFGVCIKENACIHPLQKLDDCLLFMWAYSLLFDPPSLLLLLDEQQQQHSSSDAPLPPRPQTPSENSQLWRTINSAVLARDTQARCKTGCAEKYHYASSYSPCSECKARIGVSTPLDPTETWTRYGPQIRRIHRTVTEAAVGKRMFQTADGKLGLGPASSQKGDEVHILSGGFCPYVLRRDYGPQRLGRAAYQLQGDCYLEGMPLLDLDKASEIALV